MRLRSIGLFKEAIERRPGELVKAREGGAKVVGYFCCNTPEEIIYALGLIPIRLGRGGNDRLVELGSRYISTKNCAFIRECVGLFAQGQDIFIKNSDLVAVAATCLQMFRLAELIEYYFGAKIAVLGVPRNFYLPEGQEYFERELEDFTSQLESFAGKSLDRGDLARSVQLYNDIRKAMLEIYQWQASEHTPISWREVFEIIHAGFYLERAYYLSLLQELLAEIKDQVKEDASITGSLDKKPRILLSGTIIAPGDFKLIDLIEQMGGRIVADDLCSGVRPFLNLTIQEPSVPEIARAYLNRTPCASLPYLDMESDLRLRNLVQMISDYQAEGVIYHTLRYCDPFTFKAAETKDVLREKVPFLEIHTEYATSDVESVRTRVEAFLDLIHTLRLKAAS